MPGTGISDQAAAQTCGAFLARSFSCRLYAQEVSETQAQKQLPLQMDSGAEFAEPGQSLTRRSRHIRIRFDVLAAGKVTYLLAPLRILSLRRFTLDLPPPATIQRMESAFYCNDTPFVDQVRLAPRHLLARSRVKLDWLRKRHHQPPISSWASPDRALHNLSAFGGNGFLAVHTPPLRINSAGINMTFYLASGSETVQSGDSSAPAWHRIPGSRQPRPSCRPEAGGPIRPPRRRISPFALGLLFSLRSQPVLANLVLFLR